MANKNKQPIIGIIKIYFSYINEKPTFKLVRASNRIHNNRFPRKLEGEWYGNINRGRPRTEQLNGVECDLRDECQRMREKMENSDAWTTLRMLYRIWLKIKNIFTS